MGDIVEFPADRAPRRPASGRYIFTGSAAESIAPVDEPLDEPTPIRVGERPTQTSAPTGDKTRLEAAKAAAVVWAGRARTVATHERTQTTARALVRHTAYVVSGTALTARRAWDTFTTSRYDRMMRAAEAAGQHDQVMQWEERAAAFKTARHARFMAILSAPVQAAKAAAVGVALTGGGLFGLGVILAVGRGDAGLILAPTMGFIEFVTTLVWVLGIVWDPMLMASPLIAIGVMWSVGRRHQAAPRWALPDALRTDTDGEPITPSIVVTALRDLGIAPLRKAILDMGDSGAGMLGLIKVAGCGVEVDVTLPSGVSTEEVQKRRRKLAENLGRHEHEVFITIPTSARTVRLWVADSGALDEPIGPSPLVTDPTLKASYATGRAPWGQNLRGDAAFVSLYQRHLLITGLSNQGKTAALRALALWLALDKKVELRIADLKGVGDWAMFEGIATTLIQGPTDEHVAQATEMIEEGVQEMERRTMAALSGKTFRPLVLIVDEAQVAFMCPAKGDDGRPYGGTKATSRYFLAARKLHNQGRAVDTLLWQGTQDPTDQNLPKLVREGAHIRASLAVGTEEQAKMGLGDKAVMGGAAPHKLRQGLDKGTVVVAAGDAMELAAGQSSETVRTHFVDKDEAWEIAARAKALRAGMKRTTAEPVKKLDPLADIAEVLGDVPRMRTQEVLSGLAALRPSEYQHWTFGDLGEVLEAAGAPAYKTGGLKMVSRDKVAGALSRRLESDAE